MKVKNWLYPVVLTVSALAVAIAMFFPMYAHIEHCGILDLVYNSYGIFTNFAGLELFGTYIGITGVFASSYLILGFVGLLLSVILTLLKMSGFDIQKFGLCNKIAAGVALVGTIGFIVSALFFVCINHSNLGLSQYPDAYEAIVGLFPLWLAMAGLLIGTIASFIGAHEIAEEEATSAPTKIKKIATAQKVEVEENKKEEKQTAKAETSEETAGEVIIETKAVLPEEKPAPKQTSSKGKKSSAEAKFVAKKSQSQKKTTAKTTTKSTKAPSKTTKKTTTKTSKTSSKKK